MTRPSAAVEFALDGAHAPRSNLHYTARVALVVHRSNRIERLAQSLAEVVQAPLADAFARECIVVQGPGMERWLAGYLARQLGIWANPWFPFPRTLLELFLDAVLGAEADDAAAKPFAPEALTWLVAKQLPSLLTDPAFHEVAAYLRNDERNERLIDLSSRLAANFDQYVVYRPELVLRWEQGEEQHFQAKLFRALKQASRAPHLAERLRAFERAMGHGARLASTEVALPERISLFGISTLPPAFIGMFARIAEQIDVHVYLLTPSREYWGDLDQSQRTRRDLHGLLAQLGKVSREFLELLEAHPYEEPAAELFESPGHGTILRALQSDLVELRAREQRGTGAAAALAVALDDDSLRVHVCHSVLRELEVLRDQLRARFERDATLEPRDVIVFAPDIERYAPAIEAVFGESSAGDERHIPFRIADRRAARVSEVCDAFFALLDLVLSRLHVSDVLDLLHRECVRTRFDIAENEIDRLQHWLAGAGARWAVDAAHRSSFGQPAFAENSLRFALERLLVGYAAGDGERRELFEVLPFSDAEGRDALLLGKLARYLDVLFGGVRALSQPRTPASYVKVLSELLGALLSDEGELASEHHVLRGALAEVASEAELAGFAEPVALPSLRRLLEQRLDRGRANLGFLAGGVTFCEPVPMRAIPFRVVCLLGLDDESFPRTLAKPAFDLLAEQPRPGDRTLRDDDRQLFLEALLSARDALHLSYVGRSAQDDSERPASVLVDQLLRLCDQHFLSTDESHTLTLGFEGSVSRTLRREHALQRFDARYFQRGKSSALFSYDESAASAARSLLEPKRAARAFAREPLPPLQGKLELSLEALLRFFRRPQELFLKERLKVYLPRELEEVADREPIALDALDRYRLADDLLQQRDDLPREERARLLHKAGRLGPGAVGKAQLEELEALVDGVLAACSVAAPLPDREFSLELPSGRLFGRLRCLNERAQLVRSVGTLHTKRRLSAFITHLALCATGEAPRRTELVGREKKKDATRIVFNFVEDARDQLESLLALYRIGMCMPLPIFHDAAEVFARERLKGSEERTALERAQLKLAPGRGQIGNVLEEPHVLQVFGRERLLDVGALAASDGTRNVTFADVSEALFGSLLRHTEGSE